MANTTIDSNVAITGDLNARGTLVVASGNHASSRFDSNGRRVAEYVEHEHLIHYSTAADTTTVAAITKTLATISKVGEVVDVIVFPVTAPTGGDLAYTVDIKKSTGAGVFASILSSVVTVNSSSVDRTAQTATLSGTPALAAGDALQIVIATSGSTGTQGAGVVVTIRIRMNPAT